MGMSFSAVNAASTMSGINLGSWQVRQQGYRDLMSSLQAGDLPSAQRAFRAMNGGTSTVQGGSPLGQIGQALMKGDLAGAQQAAEQLQSIRSGLRPTAQLSGSAALTATGTGSRIHFTA